MNEKEYLEYIEEWKIQDKDMINHKCNLKPRQYKYDIGDVINGKYSDIEIIKKIIINYKNKKNTKGYIYKCMKCGNIDKITEYQVYNAGCNMCCPSPQKVIKGINDIFTTNPEMVEYFVNIKDAYTHSFASNKKVMCICPNCKKKKSRKISKLYLEGLACSCGDKVSYPNKFICGLLKQLNVNFEIEKTFSWSRRKRYDIYLLNNYIIENNGVQHYEESPRGLSLKEEQENDKLKKKLALQNGIKEENYIVIDCRKSELEFIKQNVLNSRLNEIFDLRKIDWLRCEEFACNNLVKEVSDIKKNNPNITVYEISKIMKYGTDAIRRWLKQGNELNWCDYNPKEEMKKSAKNNRVLKSIISIDNGLIFESARDIERKSEEIFGNKLDYRNISAVCLGKQKTHKGFSFKFIQDLSEEEIKQIQLKSNQY